MIKASICLILAALGAGTGWWLFNAQTQPGHSGKPVSVNPRNSSNSAPADRIDLTLPKPELTPREVVEIQLDSWRASAEDPDALIAAYSMASPQNRQQTGPFQRFASMVSSEPFNALPEGDQWLIGEEHIEDNFATVLVSLTRQDEILAFRFYLRKQEEPPYTDCWMTDTVEPQQLADLPTEEN